VAAKDNPKITRLDIVQGPGQPDAQLIVWPEGGPSKGPGAPDRVPGQTDAPNPRGPNVVRPK